MKYSTTLDQIQILSDILPLESADKVMLHEEPYETSDTMFDGIHEVLCVPFTKYDKGPKTKYRNITYFPCWSTGKLLDLLPSVISVRSNITNEIYDYRIDIRKEKIDDKHFLYQIAYGSYGENGGSWHDMVNSKQSSSLTEVCVSIIEALHRNKLFNFKD